MQLSGKISICQLFVFFLVFLDSQEIVCVHTHVCVCVCVCVCARMCGGALKMREETEPLRKGVEGRS